MFWSQKAKTINIYDKHAWETVNLHAVGVVEYKSHCRAVPPCLDCRARYFDSND